MTYHNFMLADIHATLLATLLYALFLFVPGYVVSWTFDLLDFRRQSVFLKCATAVAVSCALSPIVAYLSWTFFSLTMVWIVFCIFWAGFIALMVKQCLGGHLSKLHRPDRQSVTLFALAILWALVATISVVDLQFGKRLYLSVIDYDYMLRTQIVSVITRGGLPAHSPSFYPGHFVPLRYHFFGMLLASLVQQLSGGAVTARNAMLAFPLWCGLVLIAVICLYLRFLRDNGDAESRGSVSVNASAWKRKAVISVALVAATGLDILPTAHIFFTQHMIFPDMEWWNEQITSWVDTLLWVPHHLASLLACLTGFLIFFRGAGSNTNRNVVIAVISGLAYASAVGMSVYLGFVFAVFAVQWCLLLARKQAHRELGTLALSGVIGLACLLPFVAEVASSAAGASSGGTFVQFKVRGFVLAERFLVEHHLSDPGLITLGDLFTLPVNYFLELGFFFLVMVWRLKRFFKQRKRTNAEWCAVLMLITGLWISMFLRSSTISNNDLGWRSCLFIQFIALLWAPDYLAALFSRKRLGGGQLSAKAQRHTWAIIAMACLILGVMGTIHQAFVLRYYAPMVDAKLLPPGMAAGWLSPDTDTGHRAYAMREAYTWLQKKLPQNAIEQHDPPMWHDDSFHGLYGERQTVASSAGCNIAIGGDQNDCVKVIRPILDLFRNPTLTFDRVQYVCKALSIDVLIARDQDDLWKKPNSWIWTTQPIFANDYVRVFSCH